MAGTGVFPVSSNIFKINTKGRTGTESDFVTIKDLETFKLTVDTKAEEWNPMDMAGWSNQAVTSKKLTVSFTGKRNYGDPGNDYIASTLLGIGQDVESAFEWILPNGDKLTMNCVIKLTSPAGGDSTKIDALDFDLLSDGKPTYTKATA